MTVKKRPETVTHTPDDLLNSTFLWDKDLEESLIGWVLVHPERAPEVVGAGIQPGHFHGYVARTLMHAITSLVRAGKAPHFHAVKQELEHLKRTDVGATDLSHLLDGVNIGRMWEDVASRIRDAARRRALYYALDMTKAKLMVDPFEDIRADLYGVLDSAEDAARPLEQDSFEAVMADVWENYRGGRSAMILTGLDGIDKRTYGIKRKGYVVLGARTSVGKTALAVSLAIPWAESGLRVSVISAEMDRAAIGQRYVGVMTGVSVVELASGELDEYDEAKFAEASGKTLPIATDDTAQSLAEVRARVMQHKRLLGGLDIVIVDYMQLLTDGESDDDKRHLEVGRISRGLKRIAKTMDVVLIALAQLGRDAEGKREPTLKDLRESGNIEQDADQVWLLWRDEKSKPARTWLKVAKNRQGPTTRVELVYHAVATRFTELKEQQPPFAKGF